mgnify:CR=1 FL=1
MMNEIVTTSALTKRYKGFAAVEELNMSVREGRIYGFIGPNGAGKSTTLKMLLGLVHPTAGEIELFGKRLTEKNRVALLRGVGSLIESPAYYGHLTARENLRVYAEILALPEKNIDEVLKIVRLDRQEGKRTSAFSLGMKQRLGLASALLGFPKLLILDEPTNGLDPSGIQEMRELIRSLPERCGMTVIVSSHLLSEVERIADDVGIIANGRMKYQGELARLEQTAHGESLEDIFLGMTGSEESL